jgi:hypothetical protein
MFYVPAVFQYRPAKPSIHLLEEAASEARQLCHRGECRTGQNTFTCTHTAVYRTSGGGVLVLIFTTVTATVPAAAAVAAWWPFSSRGW